MADEIVRSFSYNLLILARKRSLIFFITDLKVHFGISRNAVLNCLFVLHNFASMILSKNKKIRTNANRPLTGNLLRADWFRLLNCRLHLKNCTTIKPTLQTAFLRLKCLSQKLPLFNSNPMESDSNSSLCSFHSNARNHNTETSWRVKTLYLIYTRLKYKSNIRSRLNFILPHLFWLVKHQMSTNMDI